MSVSQTLYKSFLWKSIQFAVSLVTTVMIARILKPSASAEFYSIIYEVSLFSAFFTFGLDVSLNYFLARHALSARRASNIIVGISLLAVCISAPAIGAAYALPDMANRKVLMLLTALLVSGTLMIILGNSIFTAHGHNHFASKLTVGWNLASLVTIIAVSRHLDWTDAMNSSAVTVLLWLWCATSFLLGLTTLIVGRIRFGGPVPPATQPVTLVTLIRFSAFAFIINFIFFVAVRLPVFLLPDLSDLSSVGNYVQAYRLLEYFNAVVSFIYFPMIALVASSGEAGMKTRILAIIRIFNTVSILLCVVLVTTGHWIFPVIFGNGFDRMYTVFVCLTPAFVLTPLSSFITAHFFGTGRFRYNAISACIFFLVVMLLFFPLTREYGVHGAAIALSAGQIAASIVDLYYFSENERYAWYHFFLANRSDIRLLTHAFRQLRNPENIL